MRKRKSPVRLAVSEIIGLILLVLALTIANYLTYLFDNTIYLEIVDFFNENFLILVLLSLVYFVGDLFGIFIFPVNLPAPIFRAVGSTMLTVFIVRIFELLEILSNVKIFSFIYSIKNFVYVLVFLLVLILGYINLFTNEARRKDFLRGRAKAVRENKETERVKKDKIVKKRKNS